MPYFRFGDPDAMVGLFFLGGGRAGCGVVGCVLHVTHQKTAHSLSAYTLAVECDLERRCRWVTPHS